MARTMQSGPRRSFSPTRKPNVKLNNIAPSNVSDKVAALSAREAAVLKREEAVTLRGTLVTRREQAIPPPNTTSGNSGNPINTATANSLPPKYRVMGMTTKPPVSTYKKAPTNKLPAPKLPTPKLPTPSNRARSRPSTTHITSFMASVPSENKPRYSLRSRQSLPKASAVKVEPPEDVDDEPEPVEMPSKKKRKIKIEDEDVEA